MICSISRSLLSIIYLTIFFTAAYTLSNEEKSFLPSSKSENTTDFRLPDTVIPNEYVIYLNPHLKPNNFTFSGEVIINARVVKVTNEIILHMDGLQIVNISVSSLDKQNILPTLLHIKSVTSNKKYDFLNITMKSPISSGRNIRIDISYKGILNTGHSGFYRRWYKIHNETRWIAATHFQPTGARQVFPCFDEPALKAVFHVSVVAPKNYTVLSNMPVKCVTKEGLFDFEKTPLMSTYLIAVVVSDFQNLKLIEKNHLYKVWTNAGIIDQLPSALFVTTKAVDFFESKLSIPYTLPKLDAVAMPDYLGAMENWGLTIYRENVMLYNPAFTSITRKRFLRNAITHETAHQWFGNLVSPKWWNFLWLSEAFATYFEDHAHEDDLIPWNLEAQFVIDNIQYSFSADALSTSAPMTREVYSPDDIDSAFDSIVYSKGASIVRMLEKLLGQKLFYSSLHRYLQKNEYSHVTPELLYEAFEEEIKANNFKLNITMEKLMNSWTLQPGFPVINVKFNNTRAYLKQNRFLLQPSKDVINGSTWIVPISWATATNPNFNNTSKVIWLSESEKYITIENSNKDWVIFNIQQTGYYRVNYDKIMWERIIKLLKSKNYAIIHEINRASLVDDLLNLGRSGLLDYDLILTATEYLSQETNFIPWKSALNGFNYLKIRFTDHPEIYKLFKTYVTSLLEPNYRRLGFNDVDGEELLDTHLRELTLQWLCSLDYQECLEKSLISFKRYKQNSSYTVPPNQQNFVYCVAIKYGSLEDWDLLWKKFDESDSSVHRMTILSGLACSQNSTNLRRLLFNTITPERGINKHDLEEVFTYVFEANCAGINATLDFIETNYNKIKDYIGDEKAAESILKIVSRHLSTKKQVEKYNQFIQNNKKTMSNITESLQNSFKDSLYGLKWYDLYAPRILKWLNENYLISKIN